MEQSNRRLMTVMVFEPEFHYLTTLFSKHKLTGE